MPALPLRLCAALAAGLALAVLGSGAAPPTAAAQENARPPAADGGKGAGKAPPPVSYSREIHPLLMLRCSGCHGPDRWWVPRERAERGFDVTTYESLMKGGKSGPAVVPNRPEGSLLVRYLESKSLVIGNMPRMPFNGAPLPPDQIALFKRWIQEGARRDEAPPGGVTLRLPNVRISNPKAPVESFVCRIPAESYATVRVLDPRTGKVLAARGGTVQQVGKGKEQDLGSAAGVNEWLFWSLDPAADNAAPRVTFPGVVDVELVIEHAKGDLWGAEFNVERPELESRERQKFDPNPVSLAKDKKGGAFSFFVGANANVEVEIARDEAGRYECVFCDTVNDVAAGLRTYVWDLRGADGMPVNPGAYQARFRCKPRDTTRELRDACILFAVMP